MFNVNQKAVFKKIISQIEHINKHELKLCQCNWKNPPVRLFCSGVGGIYVCSLS